MDFFQRIGNWLGGKGWVSDEEKRRKEQQVTPIAPQQPRPQPSRAVEFHQQRAQSQFGSSKPWWEERRDTQPKPLGTPQGASQSATQLANSNAMETQRRPQFEWNAPKPQQPKVQATSNPYKPQMTPTQDEASRMPKMLSPEGQQEWVKKDRLDKQVAADAKKAEQARQEQTQSKKPGFFDFLNPFGEHGLFGAKQQQLAKNVIEKPIKNVTGAYEKWVDSSDKQQGFQWNDLGDYLRFAAKLPSGMATGLAEAPNKIANTITGKRVKDDGTVENLNGWQRFGSGVDALISTGGLATGGSGTLFRSIAGQGAKQAAKQGLKQTVVNGAKNLAKDAAKEGLEEGVQTFAQDLSDDGKINTDWRQYRDAVAMGALGGSIMHGTGKGVSAVRNAYRGGTNTPVQHNPYREADKASTKLADLERDAARQMQLDRHNASLPLKDAEFNQGAVERLAKGLEHGTVEDIAFIRMRPELLEEVNAIRANSGLAPFTHGQVTAYKNAVNNHLRKRVNEGMSPTTAAHMAADAFINPEAHAYSGTKSREGYDRNHIQIVASPDGEKYNSAAITGFDDGISLKSVSPRNVSEIKKAQAALGTSPEPRNPEGIGTSSGLGNSAEAQGPRTSTVAKTGENVNGATQDIPQFIREAAHRHDVAQGFVKEQLRGKRQESEGTESPVTDSSVESEASMGAPMKEVRLITISLLSSLLVPVATLRR